MVHKCDLGYAGQSFGGRRIWDHGVPPKLRLHLNPNLKLPPTRSIIALW